MKRIIGFIGALSTQLFLIKPLFAAEVSVCPTNPPFSKLCELLGGADAFSKIVQFIITILLTAAVVISLVFLIYGGIRWILSGGDKQAIENARNTIVAAIVGLVISLLAFFVLNLIATALLNLPGGLFKLPFPSL